MTGTIGRMEDDEWRQLGEEVKAARLAKKLSKEAAARLAGVSTITYKRVEDGKPVRDTSLMQVLDALGLVDGTIESAPDLARSYPNSLAELQARVNELAELIDALVAIEQQPRPGLFHAEGQAVTAKRPTPQS